MSVAANSCTRLSFNIIYLNHYCIGFEQNDNAAGIYFDIEKRALLNQNMNHAIASSLRA
ncbi:MAG TPA: hypothetical protein V6D35_01825 [Candidatus Sericytochromatia bacterium]